MNAIKQFWAWLTGLFATDDPTRPVEQTKPAEHPQDVVQPRADKIAQTPAEYDQPVDQQEEYLQLMISLITANAETYEMDRRELMEAWNINNALFVEAAYLVDWAAVVRKYSGETIDRVLSSGTKFNFKRHPDLQQYVSQAIAAESAARTPPAPKNHGMGGETPSQPSGYVRKAGAGGGLDSWVWVRKDRGPTAAEEQAIREFQAKLDRQA